MANPKELTEEQRQRLIEKEEEDAAIRELREHHDVLLAVGNMLQTQDGCFLFRYLFKHFEVSQMPGIEELKYLDGNMLYAKLGLLQAGNSIFKLASEANPAIAGRLLAQVEKERYDQLRMEADKRRT